VALPGSDATIAPLFTSLNSPLKASYPLSLWLIIASPCVAVSILFLNPINPLEGISNSRCCKSPLGSMICRSPFLMVTKLTALLDNCSGTSITRVSNGSLFTPSISFNITFGLPTWSSYPSLLIVSINTDKWRIPRP